MKAAGVSPQAARKPSTSRPPHGIHLLMQPRGRGAAGRHTMATVAKLPSVPSSPPPFYVGQGVINPQQLKGGAGSFPPRYPRSINSRNASGKRPADAGNAPVRTPSPFPLTPTLLPQSTGYFHEPVTAFASMKTTHHHHTSQLSWVHPNDGVALSRGPPIRRHVFGPSFPIVRPDQSVASTGSGSPGESRSGPGDDGISGGFDSEAAYDDRSDDAIERTSFKTPSLFSVDEDSDAAALRLWRRLQTQRTKIKDMRRTAAALRRQLKVLRGRVAEADNSFMSFARGYSFPRDPAVRGPPDKGSIRLFKDLQQLRTQHGSAEAKLEDLEHELEMEEYAAEDTEDRFFQHIYQGPVPDDDDGALAEEDVRPPSRTSLLGIPVERPVDVHPLYRQLLDAIGEHTLAQEDYEDIIGQRDAILHTIEVRRKIDIRRDLEGYTPEVAPIITEEELEALRTELSDQDNIDKFLHKYNIQLDQYDLDVLASFPESHKTAVEKIGLVTTQIKRLRAQCIDQGVMPKHPTVAQEYIILNAIGQPTTQLLSSNISIGGDPPETEQPEGDRLDLAHPKFHVLLSNPKHVLHQRTAEHALREALKQQQQPRTDEGARRVQSCIKEVSIERLVLNAEPEDKSDFINRWLLQRLRTTPLEVLQLLSVFSSELKLRVNDFARWQQEVLSFWVRDGAANLPAGVFEGPVTSGGVDQLRQNSNSAAAAAAAAVPPNKTSTAAASDRPSPGDGLGRDSALSNRSEV